MIKSEQHYGPSDAIQMTATTVDTQIPVTLYPWSSHIYFAEVRFTHRGTYTLDTSVLYRSYFWEFPEFHPYLPNHFISKNKLIVHPKDRVQLPCLSHDSLKDIVWKRDQDGNWRFVSHCGILQGCTFPRNIHVWGDNSIRRYVRYVVETGKI